MDSTVKRFDELEGINQRLANEIGRAERDKDYQTGIALKREYHMNKIEMLDLLEGTQGQDEGVSLTQAIAEMQAMPFRPKYATGVDVVDNHFEGGFEDSQLIMLGGEKGAGKTAFALQMIYNIANGHPAVFYSYEMPVWKMAQRAVKSHLTSGQTDRIILVGAGRDIDQLEKSIRSHAAMGRKFFGVDSLMKITNKRNAGKRNEQISDITDRLAALAIELGLLIVLIVQVAKADLQSGHMAVKGSGDADYDADIMLFFVKDKAQIDKRDLICEKNRQNGVEFKEAVYVDKESVIMYSMGSARAPVTIHYEDAPEGKKENMGMSNKIEAVLI